MTNPETVPFFVAQATLWFFVLRAWVLITARPPAVKTVRYWWACGSLLFASVALCLTTVMSVYARAGQKHPYDVWESRYLLYTSGSSFMGILLGVAGKSRPRAIGLITSLFTFLVALGDAVSM